MEDRVGDEFDALIISTTKFGFFVELADLFVEGLVPIDTLTGDRYNYHENTRKIIGERTRRVFSIGDTVRVRLDRVDAVERKLQFSLVEPARQAPPLSRSLAARFSPSAKLKSSCGLLSLIAGAAAARALAVAPGGYPGALRQRVAPVRGRMASDSRRQPSQLEIGRTPAAAGRRGFRCSPTGLVSMLVPRGRPLHRPARREPVRRRHHAYRAGRIAPARNQGRPTTPSAARPATSSATCKRNTDVRVREIDIPACVHDDRRRPVLPAEHAPPRRKKRGHPRQRRQEERHGARGSAETGDRHDAGGQVQDHPLRSLPVQRRPVSAVRASCTSGSPTTTGACPCRSRFGLQFHIGTITLQLEKIGVLRRPVAHMLEGGALWLGCLTPAPRAALTIEHGSSFVRSSIELKHPDRNVAAYLRTVKLRNRLDERVIVELQAAGAGPRTVEALRALQEASKTLPAVPAPNVTPPPRSRRQRRRVEEDHRSHAPVCHQLHQAVAQLHLHPGDPPLRRSHGPRILAERRTPSPPASATSSRRKTTS